jgi:hypothetical protein
MTRWCTSSRGAAAELHGVLLPATSWTTSSICHRTERPRPAAAGDYSVSQQEASPRQASPGEIPLLHVAFLKIGYFFPLDLNV